MILIFDNYDSFTYNLVDYFCQLGVDTKLYKNDTHLSEIKKHNYDGIVISPGGGKPKDNFQIFSLLEHYYKHIPILGICLGHQAIASFFNGKIAKAIKPMHGKVSTINCNKVGLFQGVPSKIEVVRYHSLIINELPPQLEIIAKSEDKEIMAIQHKQYPVYGLQFHPEAALTKYGLKILDNWLINHNMKN